VQVVQRVQVVVAALPEAQALEPLEAALRLGGVQRRRRQPRLRRWDSTAGEPPPPPPPPQQQQQPLLLQPMPWAPEWVACPQGLHILVTCPQVRRWGSHSLRHQPRCSRLHFRLLLAAFHSIWTV
jgi:hypothetical protein